jgi:hypothetical protein
MGSCKSENNTQQFPIRHLPVQIICRMVTNYLSGPCKKGYESWQADSSLVEHYNIM